MTAYTVRHRYSAARDGQRFGPWEAGDRVELTEADAAWVNRDSPDTLAPVDAAAETEPKGPAVGAADRSHKGGRRRAGA